jgi:uncharacterized membrane protein (UPF0127 family)
MARTLGKFLKPEIIIVTVGLIIFIVGIASWWQHYHSTDTLSVNSKKYHLLVAATPAVQEKGLGDRASLSLNEAMLFEFTTPAKTCFWMKDMQFPLDMVWVNSQKQVISIESNVSPSTYPETFCPEAPAQYVFEFNAGQAKAAGLQLGQTLNF